MRQAPLPAVQQSPYALLMQPLHAAACVRSRRCLSQWSPTTYVPRSPVTVCKVVWQRAYSAVSALLLTCVMHACMSSTCSRKLVSGLHAPPPAQRSCAASICASSVTHML